jgi:hypothetical protein
MCLRFVTGIEDLPDLLHFESISKELVVDLKECPRCKSKSIDLTKYISLMMVSMHQAVFTVRCPVCGHIVRDIWPIPQQMMGQVMDAARRLGAGMGISQQDDDDTDDEDGLDEGSGIDFPFHDTKE